LGRAFFDLERRATSHDATGMNRQS
jgi:hypothetical protein